MSDDPSQNTFSARQGLLVVHDDWSWVGQLPVSSFFGGRTVDANLRDGLSRMDPRHRWEAAVFRVRLPEGELPFGNGRLGEDAAYILALAFMRNFSGKRVAIVSGSSGRDLEHRPIGKLMNPDLCRWFLKVSATGSYWDFTANEEHKKLLEFLAEPAGVRFREEWLDGLLAEKGFCGMEKTLGALVGAIVESSGRVRGPE